ncbi:MAG: rhomboid family intramembrane serine protease [Alphaproteobacteria bacterium]|nr:rhomboid family intramembrane serine protease [Alphaproteobacteria bacterium]
MTTNEEEPRNPDEQGKILSFNDALHRRRQSKTSVPSSVSQGPLFNFHRIPPFVRSLLSAILLINIPLLALADENAIFWTFYHFGFIPGAYTGSLDPQWPWFSFAFAPFTHMVLHGSWLHLIINTVMALAFGTLVERSWGSYRAALMFVLSGLAGVVLFALLNPDSTMPLIGASGGLSGWFGASLVLLHAQGRLGSWRSDSPWPIILFWAGLMTVVAFLSGELIAWQAHLGGFFAGALCAMRWRVD